MDILEFFQKHKELQKKYGICSNDGCIISVIYEGSGKRKKANKVKYAKCSDHGVIEGSMWEKYLAESNELYYELNGRPTLTSKKYDD